VCYETFLNNLLNYIQTHGYCDIYFSQIKSVNYTEVLHYFSQDEGSTVVLKFLATYTVVHDLCSLCGNLVLCVSRCPQCDACVS